MCVVACFGHGHFRSSGVSSQVRRFTVVCSQMPRKRYEELLRSVEQQMSASETQREAQLQAEKAALAHRLPQARAASLAVA